MKHVKHIWALGLFCTIPLMATAQRENVPADARHLFDEGKSLFVRQDYAASRQILTRYLQQAAQPDFTDEVDYMLACTAYELKEPERLEKLNAYLEKHPDSRYANRVYSLIASVYFSEEKYEETIEAFDRCDIGLLSDEERDACTMRLATACLKLNKLKDASIWFSMLEEVSDTYYPDAVYYLAYIDYVQGKDNDALNGFRRVEKHKTYGLLAPYYIAEIYLRNNNYEEAKKIAENYIANHPGEENITQMQRIRGEACYGLNLYDDAVKSLEVYHSSMKNPDRKASYELGMSYYQTGVYSKAAECLGEVTSVNDALTQNAYFHMGLSYLQLMERSQARMAFEQASSADFSRTIKEQALYNYALCIHETSYSPFAESVTVFERFLNEFPNSPYVDKVNDYLVEVYMNTRSYTAALRSIEKISHPGDRILEAKQKLLFRLGTQAFAQAAFSEAVGYFSQSLQLGRYNQQTKADAYYWRGEAKYRLSQYGDAANDLRQYMEFAVDRRSKEYGLSLYNLGYALFKQKQYDHALTWFSRCVSSEIPLETAVVADAYNRMGDCYFYVRSFDSARQQYAKALSLDPTLADYSLFQEGFVKGLQRDYSGKIETLNRLITDYPSSQYLDDALYEQGRAFIQLDDNDNAIQRYVQLTQRFPESPLSRKAANEIGLLYYQEDRYDEAIKAYKNVIATYPGSEEARLAQRDLRSIYVDLNKVDDYMNYAATIPGNARFEVSERDSLTYIAAERLYLRGNITEAKSSFERYLQSFGDGAFGVNAHYYLGLICYNQEDYANAAIHLGKVMEYPDNRFSEEAMEICAGMAYNDKDYAKALEIYKRMIDRASSQESRWKAEVGALRSAYYLKNQQEVIAMASALLAENKLAPELENEARYDRAKAFLSTGKTNEALQDLTVLGKDTRNVYGAEAKYLVAQIYFDNGETEKAEKEVLGYIEVSTPHAYWLARSFILLSDVYVKMGRELDAKQYLLSLKQNYQAEDDIAGMIETRLEKLNTGK